MSFLFRLVKGKPVKRAELAEMLAAFYAALQDKNIESFKFVIAEGKKETMFEFDLDKLKKK